MEPERSGRIIGSLSCANPNGDERAVAVKPFDIPKRLVLQAWRLVRANRGAPGVDEESLELFERDLKKNLYRIWNRMSSGSPRGAVKTAHLWALENRTQVGGHFKTARLKGLR
jgi:RNA-directed DNA polymerase